MSSEPAEAKDASAQLAQMRREVYPADVARLSAAFTLLDLRKKGRTTPLGVE